MAFSDFIYANAISSKFRTNETEKLINFLYELSEKNELTKIEPPPKYVHYKGGDYIDGPKKGDSILTGIIDHVIVGDVEIVIVKTILELISFEEREQFLDHRGFENQTAVELILENSPEWESDLLELIVPYLNKKQLAKARKFAKLFKEEWDEDWFKEVMEILK